MSLNFEKHIDEVNQFLNILSENLGRKDMQMTYRILKSVLHTLRDVISVEESIILIYQLPAYLKIIYLEDWIPNRRNKKVKHLNDFVERVISKHGKTYCSDFDDTGGVEHACRAVLQVLGGYVSCGEMDNLKCVLPNEIRNLFDEEIILT